jgi:hypothetical protein
VSQDNLGLRALTHLTRLVFRIGSQAFPEVAERLFAHQGGDAFYIASDNPQDSFDRCAAIAIALMRGMLEEGFVARAAIARGALGDYASCRPPEVRAAAVRDDESDLVRMGQGLMTLQSVLGEGIINAIGLDKRVKLKGSLVMVAQSARQGLSDGFITCPIEEFPGVIALNWIHSTSPLIDRIVGMIGYGGESAAVLEDRLRRYVAFHDMKREWSDPTFRFAGLS